jgi:hypothetical protein
VDVTKTRNAIVAEIDDLWTQYAGSVQQMERKYFYRFGEKFIELRKTFAKNKAGDNEFSAYCKKHWPKITPHQRQYYTAYRKRLGSRAKARDLPPLRHPKERKRWKKTERRKSSYKKIVDEEMGETEQFEVPQTERDVENELIAELAGKIVSAGFRVLSVKMHPDKEGGSNEAQRRLNSAKTMLQDALTKQVLRM